MYNFLMFLIFLILLTTLTGCVTAKTVVRVSHNPTPETKVEIEVYR